MKTIIKTEKNNLNIKPLNKLQKCQIHVMPTTISDEDINSLFAGLVQVVKHKIELDNRAEIVNANTTINSLVQKLKDKQAECIRLKNEILFLKTYSNSN